MIFLSLKCGEGVGSILGDCLLPGPNGSSRSRTNVRPNSWFASVASEMSLPSNSTRKSALASLAASWRHNPLTKHCQYHRNRNRPRQWLIGSLPPYSARALTVGSRIFLFFLYQRFSAPRWQLVARTHSNGRSSGFMPGAQMYSEDPVAKVSMTDILTSGSREDLVARW